MSTIVFRSDASSVIGSGHVMRCLTIANNLKERGFDCIFWSSPETADAVPWLAQAGHQVIPSESPLDLPEKAIAMIVDHYGLDAKDEARFKTLAGRIIVIDDLANRPHDCDVLMDSTLGRASENYNDLVPAGAAILTGTDYAPLRPAFAANRAAAKMRRQTTAGKISSVLVSLGSTDPHNVTTTVLNGLAGVGLKIDVVIGSGCQHLPAIKHAVETLMQQGNDVTLHMNVSNIEQLMLQADIAIGAGGTTSWERCALGLPTILIEVADNQKDNANVLQSHGCVFNLGWYEDVTPHSVNTVVSGFIKDPKAVKLMSDNAFDICDGKGVQRIVPYIIPPIDGVSLQLMGADDCAMLHAWQSQPGVREFARNPAIPTFEEHAAWFHVTLENNNRALYKIMKDNVAVGMLRLDRDKDSTRKFEISILIDNAYQGQGIAAKALAFIRNLEPNAIFIAEVLAGNEPSARLFLKSGFTKFAETLYEQRGSA